MLESLFIFMAAIAFVLFVLGIEGKNIVYAFISMMLWIIIMLNALYIEVPSVTDTFSELGFSVFCLAFVFANIVWMIILYLEFRKESVLH